VKFSKTPKQAEAIKLLANDEIRYPMLYGGSRAGKTFIAIYAIIVRASKVKSRHVILRFKFNHAKTSIWLDTLPKVLKICFPELPVEWKMSDFYIILPNGSEIWVGGLDDAQRVEKILGKEYSTLYFNECSQIPYKSIKVALTRLAEKNSLIKKAYFDMNPPTKKHWSFWVYFKGADPDSGECIDTKRYDSILMNPADNLQNIDQDYIDEVLNKLSPAERDRFLHGKFAESGEGLAYYAFDRSLNVHEIEKENRVGQIMVGMDFNVNPMTAVVGYYVNKTFYIIDEIYLQNSDTFQMCQELKRRGYTGAYIYPDATGRNRRTSGKSDHLILKENGFHVQPVHNPAVRDRVNNTNRLLRDAQVIISPSCKKLMNDLDKVEWKGSELNEGEDKQLTHISDALGYWLWALDNLVYRTPSKIEMN